MVLVLSMVILELLEVVQHGLMAVVPTQVAMVLAVLLVVAVV
jgi:hypothetical protein